MKNYRERKTGFILEGMDEKRKSPRFKMKQLIGFQANVEEYLWAEGVDISPLGISCFSNEPIDPNTNVFFMLSLSHEGGESSVRGEGYVLRSEKVGDRYRFGIKIDHIFDQDKANFQTFLESLEEETEGAASS